MKKKAEKELTDQLIEDASNPNAWDEPITVPASRRPRPESYGRAAHLELAAKFYVLSVLHRLGAEANLTFAQPDNVDITVVKRSGEACTIDVKTLTGSAHWPVEQFRARKQHFLVFIFFKREWRNPQVVPDIYIWPSEGLQKIMAGYDEPVISLKDLASRLDPTSAWQDFTVQPAA
jgi:hypothetical protein